MLCAAGKSGSDAVVAVIVPRGTEIRVVALHLLSGRVVQRRVEHGGLETRLGHVNQPGRFALVGGGVRTGKRAHRKAIRREIDGTVSPCGTWHGPRGLNVRRGDEGDGE